MANYCCSMTRGQVEYQCDLHADLKDCPDALVVRYEDNSYGLRVHDGGSSAIEISFCPWCGTRL